jgi:O-antigen ligase/tetratricopeptide (TPR) repeat protein
MKNNYQTATKSWQDWAYLIGIFLILALPLLNIPPLFYPAAWGGTITFRVIFSVLIFIFTRELLIKEGYFKEIISKIKNIPSLVSIPLAIFTGLVILSTIFSMDPLFSFWGSPYRGDGSLNLILYIIFAVFCYLVIKTDDWKKVFNAGIGAAVLVSFIGLAQQFKFLGGDFLVSYATRPPSTLGNPDTLATYLLLFIFLALVLSFKEKNLYFKIFYFSSFVLFLFVIFLTLCRATFLGLAVGLAWFLFFYRFKKQSLNKYKIIVGILLIIVLSSLIYYFNSNSTFPKIIQNNNTLMLLKSRLSIKDVLGGNGRISGWKIAWQGLKDKPLLGYGPENFSIAFDKHYDPKLADINTSFGGTWWDRAHNFLFDTGITMGIPALITYLVFFIFLFYLLHKIKREDSDNSLICLGIQTTFIAYFVNNFFSFDAFGTYIILFLLIGYTLFLVSKNNAEKIIRINERTKGLKKLILFLLFIFLIWFLWQDNIKPLVINSSINWADYYTGLEQPSCEKAKAKMEKVINNHSFLDSYVYISYADVFRVCNLDENRSAQEKENFSKIAIKTLQNAVKIRPYYTKSWIYLGFFQNYLLEMDLKNKDALAQANYYFQKANDLSPKRLEVFSEWGKTFWVAQDYNKAEEKFQKCTSLDPTYGICWWYSGLTQIYLGNDSQAKKNIDISRQDGFNTETDSSLNQLGKIYSKLVNKSPSNFHYYNDLSAIYKKLVEIRPTVFQYHATLAFVYSKLGEYDKARQEASIVLELSPASRASVGEFLKTLPQ